MLWVSERGQRDITWPSSFWARTKSGLSSSRSPRSPASSMYWRTAATGARHSPGWPASAAKTPVSPHGQDRRRWQLSAVVDAATGQIGIQLYSLTAITSAKAGSLVNITFHVVPGATVPATAVQLVDAVTPHGQSFGTVLADAQAAMILSPGVNRLEVMTPLVVFPVCTSDTLTTTTVSGQVTVDGLAPNGSRARRLMCLSARSWNKWPLWQC